MTLVVVLIAVLAGALHVGIFVAESFLWTYPKVWQAFLIADQGTADETTLFTFNQGFYNLFLAVGALAGPAFVLAGAPTIGWTLLIYACASMVAAAVVLRLGGGARYSRAALTQATLPTLALLGALLVVRSS